MMDHSSLGDFKPLEPPISVGVENTKINNPTTINENDDIDLHALKSNYMNEQAATQYYKQFIPNYGGESSQNKNHNQGSAATTQNGMMQNDTLMTKLNYMIHLLEERQDERTNNVTEEVILYSFLGVFMIFIVDSFVKVGKYVR